MREFDAGQFDIAVIGAGHAGIEAALAAARLGLDTVCLTINLDAVGNMPCNPAIGGTGKGHLVRELDALGGEMARAADRACIQYRMLNRRKGPAVWSLRAQADRRAYQQIMKHTLERQENLWLRQAEVTEILTDTGAVTGDGWRFDGTLTAERLLTGECENVPCRAALFGSVEDGAYTGSLVSGLPDGEGTFALSSGASFTGTFSGGAAVRGSLAVQPVRLWSVESPALYDLELTLERGGTVLDRVESYFGLRSVELREGCLFLNGTPVFQRLVLDQGFYPDGVYTAPDDEAIRRDILLSKSLGFNGARMHEKVFEERYLYWADRLGYLVWGEFPNWGLDITAPAGLEIFLPQWAEAMRRDFGSPALIGWCPFNETWDFGGVRQDDGVLAEVYRYTKTADPLRPCIDTSGNYHVVTDIFDIHDYEQDPKAFAAHYAGGPHITFGDRQRYGGEPYMVSEYGGARWDPSGGAGWGYGSDPRSEDEFAARYEALTRTLMQTPCCCGFCYTQLYDVEQERNGLFTYARKAKFSQKVYDRIRNVNTETAAIEKRLL